MVIAGGHLATRGEGSSPLESGLGLIELLIALVIASIGLLGLAALQGKAHQAEMESYQRIQALILLQDMASRLRANPNGKDAYLTNDANCAYTSSQAGQDLCGWSELLAGSGEILDGQSIGAMPGGHGCITGGWPNYVVTVAWQGLTASALSSGDPRHTNHCGEGLYGENDALRRIISVPVRFFVSG